MSSHFNADFYSTVATIIPVLFIALTLQGDFVMKAMTASEHWPKGSREALRNWQATAPLWQRWPAQLVWIAVGSLLYAVPTLILTFGLVGEIDALLALERQKATALEQSWVMEAGVVLTVMTVVALLVRRFELVAAEVRQRANQQKQAGETSEVLPGGSGTSWQ